MRNELYELGVPVILRDNYIRFINRTQKHRFHSVIGAVDTMRELASQFGRTFLKGQNAAAALFSPG